MTDNKICGQCRSAFIVTDADLDFYQRVSPVFNSLAYSIPPPTLCPECRQQRRLALANERFFYWAKCGLCQKNTLTEHPPYNNKTVYCRECWHSDHWDPCAYGREVDFSRPIFDQLKQLWTDVPAQNLLIEGTNENSEYIHYAGFAKNCYFIMHADFCEDCYYGYGFKKNTSCVDGFYVLRSELCYDCIDVHSCYDLTGCQDCINCSSSAFLRDCIGCKNCFLSVGLRGKEYCYGNEQLTKDQYLARLSGSSLASYRQYQIFKSRRKELEQRHIFKENHGHNTENCSGDYLVNCKNTLHSFDCEDVEDGKHLFQVVIGAKSNYDIYQYGLNLSESYECAIAGNSVYHALFSHNVHVNCSDILYCWFIQSSKNCFGCVSLHHKEYCVFNKQYSKTEYESLVPKIIGHMRKTGEWGQLFPVSFSPFGYNKTSAQMYYPMEKDAVITKGWKWDDAADPGPTAAKVVESNNLPDSISDVGDDILHCGVRCESTGKLFRITSQELKYYRKKNIPLPRCCPDQRHLDRFKLRNPRQIWNRQCANCSSAIATTYSPDRPETVYCEACYLRTIY